MYRTQRRFCPHCQELVSLKTLKAHKRLYYDQDKKTWSSANRRESPHLSDRDSTDEDSAPSDSGLLNDSDMHVSSEPDIPGNAELEVPDVHMADQSESEPEVNEEESESGAEEWNEGESVENDVLDESEPEDEIEPSNVSATASVLARWLVQFLLCLQAVYRLSNAALSCIFRFLVTFLCILGRLSDMSSDIARAFPRSFYMAKQKFCEKLKVKRYVVCRKCHRLYQFEECIERIGRIQKSKECSFKCYPLHPQRRMRAACKVTLLKSVTLSSGKHFFYPYMVYCYLGIKTALQQLLRKPEFLPMCASWKARKSGSPDRYVDVYDGKVWKDFESYNGVDFLNNENNLALMMNFDFFQPYKHVKYSVGAIYFTVLNLPRSVRYRRENVILAGIIPGPDEPERNINTYLEPIVNELQEFWKGVDIQCNGVVKRVRCALICVACDLPAGRKACGFLSYNAKFGCSKCKKEFKGTVGNVDFSGFDRDIWPVRDGEDHRRTAMTLKNPRTRTEMMSKESSSGCRYSVLIELEYFDSPRFLVVDPMHNLFLGTAKHILKDVWISKGIISDAMFERIQKSVDAITVPAAIGRIPYKIRSGFSSFTANQWQNWINYFSLLALADILGDGEHLECWRHFVLASRILCCKQLTRQKIQLADALLMQFCRRSERLYGANIVTPNMHMHTHLASCVFDYGPSHGFWLYAFERYNGVLGSFPNNRSIEIQLMERYVHDQSVQSLPLPTEFSDDFLRHFSMGAAEVGSVGDTISAHDSETTIAIPSKCRKRSILDEVQLDFLCDLYCKLYEVPRSSLDCPSCCWKHSTLELYGKQLGCHGSRSSSSSIVLANWNSDMFGVPVVTSPPGVTYSLDNNLLRAARINCFISHTFKVDEEEKTEMLVNLSWFQYHPDHFSKGKPLTVWSSEFETLGLYSCIPVSFVKYRVVSTVSVLPTTGESVLIVCPCIDF